MLIPQINPFEAIWWIFVFLLIVSALLKGLAFLLGKIRSHGPAQATPEEFIDLYDFGTKQVHVIPAREMAPWMIQISIADKEAGTKRLVWVDKRDLMQKAQLSPVQHPPFTGRRLEIARTTYERLREVDTHDYNEWEESFRRNDDQDAELRQFFYISSIYQNYTKDRELSQVAKHDMMMVLMACLDSPPDHVLDVIELNELTKEEAWELVKTFFSYRKDFYSQYPIPFD